MSVNIKRADGTLQKIAGHTIILDANASEIRQGTWSISMPATPSLYQTTVTFTDPMPDTDYAVILEMSDYTYGGTVNVQLMVFDKTVTGFKIKTHISPTSAGAISGVYTAFKPIKLDGYTELQNKVNNPDAVPTENSENLVKSGGVWEAIKNASAVWKGTQAEWNALPVADKQTYDLAVLTDAGYILAVDRTDGSSVETANLNKIWRGTQVEWDALTPAEKDEWEEAQIIDGIAIPGIPMEYSTTEQNTGMKWIDGKPIYRKVVDCGTLPNGLKSVPHGITGLGYVVKSGGYSYSPTYGFYAPIPNANPVSNNAIQLYVDSTNINLNTSTDLSQYTSSHVILEYTKTTD